MKILINIAIAFFLTTFSLAEERSWTSIDGKVITGTLIKDNEESVVILVKEKEYTVPLTRLSEADNAWVIKLRAEKKLINDKAGKLISYPSNDTQEINFHVAYPTRFSADTPLPMIILFSPGGGGKAIVNKFRASCETLGWIAVGCDTFKNSLKDSEMDPKFAKLLPIIESTVLHDEQRLYMGGFSGGAMRAFRYSTLEDRPWKGIVSCGGWLGKQYELNYPKKMVVAWVNGDNDKNANSWISKDTNILDKYRCKTKTFTFSGGHTIGPQATLTSAMQWMSQNTYLPKKKR